MLYKCSNLEEDPFKLITESDIIMTGMNEWHRYGRRQDHPLPPSGGPASPAKL